MRERYTGSEIKFKIGTRLIMGGSALSIIAPRFEGNLLGFGLAATGFVIIGSDLKQKVKDTKIDRYDPETQHLYLLGDHQSLFLGLSQEDARSYDDIEKAAKQAYSHIWKAQHNTEEVPSYVQESMNIYFSELKKTSDKAMRYMEDAQLVEKTQAIQKRALQEGVYTYEDMTLYTLTESGVSLAEKWRQVQIEKEHLIPE